MSVLLTCAGSLSPLVLERSLMVLTASGGRVRADALAPGDDVVSPVGAPAPITEAFTERGGWWEALPSPSPSRVAPLRISLAAAGCPSRIRPGGRVAVPWMPGQPVPLRPRTTSVRVAGGRLLQRVVLALPVPLPPWSDPFSPSIDTVRSMIGSEPPVPVHPIHSPHPLDPPPDPVPAGHPLAGAALAFGGPVLGHGPDWVAAGTGSIDGWVGFAVATTDRAGWLVRAARPGCGISLGPPGRPLVATIDGARDALIGMIRLLADLAERPVTAVELVAAVSAALPTRGGRDAASPGLARRRAAITSVLGSDCCPVSAEGLMLSVAHFVAIESGARAEERALRGSRVEDAAWEALR